MAAFETLKRVWLLFLFACVDVAATPRVEFIDPVATGPGISPLLELPGAKVRDLRHLMAVEPDGSRGYLYVHLPGSGGLPENSQEIIVSAAQHGYHSISLAYPNWPSVGELTSALGDAGAAGLVREERLFGTDASPLVQVDAANCVSNRLLQLLRFLQAHHPGEGWGRFFASDALRWDRIVVGGHSQGAGHVAYLAQVYPLAGGLLFGGPGDSVAGVGVADWLRRPLKTAPTRLYGFVHEQDPDYDFFQLTQSLLGLDEGGPPQRIDGLAVTQMGSHRLSSARVDVPGGNYHGAVVVDRSLPVDPDGSIGYSAVWEYMLRVTLFRDSFDD